MIFLVILIALFAWFVLFMKSKIHLFETFTDVNSILSNSRHFNNYIANIHPSMYRSKIENYNNTNFFKTYISNLRLPTLNEKAILNKYIPICEKILKENGLNKLANIPWKFLISKKGLEMNMPYTLSNYIIINELTLINLIRDKGNNANFITTLIHEKIHILQRINQGKFNTFYRQQYSFIGSKIHFNGVPLQYKKQYMTNPDSNSDFWLYKINGVYYYPILIKKGAYVKSIAFNKSGNIDLDKFKQKLGYSRHISFYHPNEIFACEDTDMIIEKNIKKQYLKLFNSL